MIDLLIFCILLPVGALFWAVAAYIVMEIIIDIRG